eukprot:1137613-Pelagomonas_calceolata.AAC.11
MNYRLCPFEGQIREICFDFEDKQARPIHSLFAQPWLDIDSHTAPEDAFHNLLRDAPNIRANLPALQTELPEDGPPSNQAHTLYVVCIQKAQLQVATIQSLIFFTQQPQVDQPNDLAKGHTPLEPLSPL